MAPAHGQHTDEILAELGRDPAQIAELRASGGGQAGSAPSTGPPHLEWASMRHGLRDLRVIDFSTGHRAAAMRPSCSATRARTW